jgi:hypothetical protein
MARQRLTPQFFEEQIAQLERERSELEDEIAWWREGYERYKRKRETRRTSAPAAPADGSRPSLRKGIQIVMGEENGKGHWRAGDLLDALKARGWEPRGKEPAAPVAAMLADMRKKGQVYWVSRGLYALTPTQDELASPANGAMDAAADEEEA